MSRTHNKSGLLSLTLLKHSDEEISRWSKILRNSLHEAPSLCLDSPCLLPTAADGRFSRNQKKVAYGYQIIAFVKFGRRALRDVESSKSSKHSKLVSHLCGTRNCCNEDHIVIESKGVNDERTHCHFCMLLILSTSGREGVQKFLELGGCPHTPRCGRIERK